uniref:Uncharacterized protein n=1 Tax=Anguilla anguilla TaxID=7936 RepID=A0A0E9VCJ2_ANGAN
MPVKYATHSENFASTTRLTMACVTNMASGKIRERGGSNNNA